MMSTPQDRLGEVLARIDAAAREAGCDPAVVKLIAVSKTFAVPDIVPVIEAGHRWFGENRVQEAKAKWPELRQRYADLELHLIGPLQSNKARDAVQLFDAIHSIDRPRIAQAVAEEMARQNRRPKLLVQINTGEEPQKAGVKPQDAREFVGYCQGPLGLEIAGLMCIPPVDEEAGVHFAFLAKMARELDLAELSMGMSADYETAVQFGATYVRVGSAIFGERPPPRP